MVCKATITPWVRPMRGLEPGGTREYGRGTVEGMGMGMRQSGRRAGAWDCASGCASILSVMARHECGFFFKFIYPYKNHNVSLCEGSTSIFESPSLGLLHSFWLPPQICTQSLRLASQPSSCVIFTCVVTQYRPAGPVHRLPMRTTRCIPGRGDFSSHGFWPQERIIFVPHLLLFLIE